MPTTSHRPTPGRVVLPAVGPPTRPLPRPSRPEPRCRPNRPGGPPAPPGRWQPTSILFWRSASSATRAGVTRCLISGRRRRVPSPEQGASSSTRSKLADLSGGNSAAPTSQVASGARLLARGDPLGAGVDGHGAGASDGVDQVHGLAPRGCGQVGDPVPGTGLDRVADRDR